MGNNHNIAVVTGASRGIGAATAIRLANDGYDICVNYLQNHKAAEETLAAVREYGVKAIAVQADISSENEVKRLFEEVDSKLGTLTALINNAGIVLPQARLVDMNADRINKVLRTNVTGYFLCCQQAIKRMSTKAGGSGGSIVNISSAAARIGSAEEYIDYAASKGAVDTLTMGLAKEVAAEHIRVNCVRPGFIHTDMHASAGEPDRVERLKSTLPLSRGGRPDEIAAAVAWLVSEEASYTCGAFLDVAGGR